MSSTHKDTAGVDKDQVRIARLLGKLDAAWRAFQASYAGLTDDQLLAPGVCGAWSVRDLIAHVAWWDEEALTHLPVILAGGRSPRYADAYGGIDAFNALMTQRKRSLSLTEVLAEHVTTHQRLLDYLHSLPTAEILANERFKRRLRLDTYGHYPIHTEDVLRWRRLNHG